MSRNLCRTDCVDCGGVVKTTAAFHTATVADCGRYIDQYGGMLVAPATCTWCGALYTAWHSYPGMPADDTSLEFVRGECGFVDLSWRSTFNDEPGDDDRPGGGVVERVDLTPVDDDRVRVEIHGRGRRLGSLVTGADDGLRIRERLTSGE